MGQQRAFATVFAFRASVKKEGRALLPGKRWSWFAAAAVGSLVLMAILGSGPFHPFVNTHKASPENLLYKPLGPVAGSMPHASQADGISERPDCQECYHTTKPRSIADVDIAYTCACLTEGRVSAPGPFDLTSVEGLYLDLVKQTVLNTIYRDSPAKQDGRVRPKFEDALTMLGKRRLDNVHELLQAVVRDKTPGGFIETGVWRGGVGILAAAIFQRRVWLADSFKGIPPPDPARYPADAAHIKAHRLMRKENNSAEAVIQSFQRFNLYDEDRVRVLVGYFNETLAAEAKSFSSGFALIHLDGDTYESTITSLQALYPYLSVGGYVIVDDYQDWEGCRRAVLDFREGHRINSPGERLVAVYHDVDRGEIPRGIWWQKLTSHQ